MQSAAVHMAEAGTNVWTRRALQEKTLRQGYGLAPMYQASFEAHAPGHHGNLRASYLISDHASKGLFVPSVLGCAGKTNFPSRLFLSQTWVGNGCRD